MRSHRGDCHYCGYHRNGRDKTSRKSGNYIDDFYFISDKIPDYKRKGLCLTCKKVVGVSRHHLLMQMEKYDCRPPCFTSHVTERTIPDEIVKRMGKAGHNAFYGEGCISCSSCGKLSRQIGYDFRAPKQKDSKAWKVLKVFLEDGRQRIMEGMETLVDTRPTFRNLFWTRVEVRVKGKHLVNFHVNPILDKSLVTNEAKLRDLLGYTFFTSCFRPFRLKHSFPTSVKALDYFIEDLVNDVCLLDQDPLTFNFRRWSTHLREKRMRSLWSLLRSYVRIRCITLNWLTRARKSTLMKRLVEEALVPGKGALFKEAEEEFYLHYGPKK